MLTRIWRLTSCTYVTLGLLALIGKTCAKNATGFLGAVENLTVNVFEDEKYVENGDPYKSLKLNISWSAPAGDRKPSSYSVIVTGIPGSMPIGRFDANVLECPEESIFYTSPDGSQLNVLLPENNIPVDLPQLHILPNCSYRVQVLANPRTRPVKNLPDIVYTVPECVGRRCSCANVGSILPIPYVYAAPREKSLLISWNITSNYVNVRSFAISIGVPLLTSKNGLPVYNITTVAEVPTEEERTAFSWTLNHEMDQHVDIKVNYMISVAAMDHHGCVGTRGNFLLSSLHPLSEPSENVVSEWSVYVVPVALGTCILFVALSFAVSRYKQSRKYRYFRGSQSSRICAVTKCKSRWAEAFLQKRNILYVLAESEAVHADENDKLEISYKSVNLIRELGKGQFGRVYLGRLADLGNQLVAVKTSHSKVASVESESRRQLMEEIEMMRMAGSHPHLVNLVGYCTQPDKPVCIILEYMEGGDLLAYLHSRKKIQKGDGMQCKGHFAPLDSIAEGLYTRITTTVPYAGDIYTGSEYDPKYINICGDRDNSEAGKRILHCTVETGQFFKFALDIASGMKYLENKGITHRDLAARNILIGPNLILKISDFGLSRNGIYVINSRKGKTRHLPIRWMSPEAIQDRAFSSKSDVWSYAIVLWEIGSLGAFPYSNIEDNHLLRHIIRENGRLERPEDVPSVAYDIMRACWASEPDDRPNFAQLFSSLQCLYASLCSITSASNPCYALPCEDQTT